MSITTYNDLKSAIGDWTDRDNLAAQIPDFITLFEAYAVRELGVEEAEATATLTPSSGSVALPSDFLTMKSLTWSGSTARELTYLNPAAFSAMYATEESGTPVHYTIKAGNIIIRPISTENLSALYRAKASAAASALDWLFNNHIDAYLAGSIMELKVYEQDFENALGWAAKRDQVFASIRKLNFTRRPAMQILAAGPTP
jgi:hypothetical protein